VQLLRCRTVRHAGSTDFRAPWSAHAWTILPNVWHDLIKRQAPAGEPWSTNIDDPQKGRVSLCGSLRREAGARGRRCLVIVHGLGGSYDRPYCVIAAHAAQRAGLSCLLFGLRGTDRQGDDFYHGGLWADVHAAVSSDALADFEALYVLGYSLGGHVSLRYAIEGTAARVRAVAAVCAPLDLELSSQHIDAPSSYVYRRHVLSGLNEIYGAVAERRNVPTPLSQVLRAQSLRTWDSLTVVPRFGFENVAHYYGSMSVGPNLPRLQVPSLLVQSTLDPMVPPWTYERYLAKPLPRLEVRRYRAGGHVAFPRVPNDNGQPVQLEAQIIDWFQAWS
jgi:predicted alpha/beta-fold hydrolase